MNVWLVIGTCRADITPRVYSGAAIQIFLFDWGIDLYTYIVLVCWDTMKG